MSPNLKESLGIESIFNYFSPIIKDETVNVFVQSKP